MSLYDTYETDPKVEQEGVWHTFEGFKIRIARAGGANTAYLVAVAEHADALRAAADQGSFLISRPMAQVYVDTIIKGLEETEPGALNDRDGIQVTIGPALVDALAELPDLFREVTRLANERKWFCVSNVTVLDDARDAAEPDIVDPEIEAARQAPGK